MPEIDKRICALEAELVELKRQRNVFAPIRRLPSEILVCIFHHLQYPMGYYPLHAWTNFDRSWTQVTYVCYFFRLVALETAHLWSVVDFTGAHSAWRDIYLKRSRCAPLSVRSFDVDTGDVAEQWPRVSAAELRGSRACRLLERHSLQLKVLRMLAMDASGYIHVSASMLMQSCQHLVHLKLADVYITLEDLPPMLFLRHLHLDEVRIQSHPNFDQLGRFLEMLPALEGFVSKYLYPPGSESALDAVHVMHVSRRISLPRLDSISIEDGYSEASALMRLLPRPRSTLRLLIQSVSDQGAVLGANQNLDSLHSSWLELVGSHPRAEPHPCRVTCGGPIYAPVSIDIGETESTHMDGQEDTHASFFSVECLLDKPHLLLDRIETLRFKGLPYYWRRSTDSLESACNVQVLHRLQTILLEGVSEADIEAFGHMKEWISKRQGRVQHVRLVGYQSLEHLAETWQEEGLAAVVSWHKERD
jgi:hypothetical protein